MNALFDQQLADITLKPARLELRATSTQDLTGLSWVGLAVNCTPQFASKAGNKLAEKSGTFGATWCAGDNGKIFLSLRSSGNYDVSEIAKFYGGGGHKNAAGFNIPFHCLKWNQELGTYYVEQPYD